jgi:phage FluMu protein Com
MLITFKCHHCAQEFEADGLQAQETCPHCQAVNQVLAHGHYADGPAEVPPTHFTASSANAAVRPCRACQALISRKAWICVHCGDWPRHPFFICWDIMGNLAIIALIFVIIGALFGLLYRAAVSANAP